MSISLPIPLRTEPAEGLDDAEAEFDDELRALALRLADAYESRGRIVVEGLTGLSFRDGLAVQRSVLRHHVSRGSHLGGWKIGLTSGPNRSRMGEGFRPFGYVLAHRVLESPATIELAAMRDCNIEPELCLILGRALHGPCTPAEARAAVGAVCGSFEINESRLVPGIEPPILLADDMANWGIVTGEQIEPPSDDLTQTRAIFECDGEIIGEEVPGETMDDPFVSLSRLASELAAFGEHLHPGDRVITGAFFRKPVESPGHWRVTFSDIGTVEVDFV